MQEIWGVIGRVLLVVIFLLSGILKFMGLKAQAGYAAQHHVPLPMVAIIVAALIEVIGGLLVISGGQRARIAAIVLALYLIPVTIYIHVLGGVQAVEVLKNIAIIGGLVLVAASAGTVRSHAAKA